MGQAGMRTGARRQASTGRHGRRPPLVAVLAVVAALVAGGCSDDDGGDGEAGATTEAETTTTTTTAPPASSLDLPTTKEQPADLPGYNVYRPADLEATEAPLGVVVWANGGCVRYDVPWEALLTRWAEAGFVVVSITGTPPPNPQDALKSPSSPADQAKAVDWAAQQNEQDGGPYAGHLDLDKVVAAGNSCGGITSLNLASTDPRVKAVFVLSGSSVGPGATAEQASAVMGKVNVPVGFVVGGPEDVAQAAATIDYDVLPADVPGSVVSRNAADHRTVSTDPQILADVAEISVNWLDLAVNGNGSALEAFSDNPCGDCEPGVWTVKAKHLDTLVEE